jgi:D-alanyl-D-alanine carboxypeptidase/D-alanyl-D-alanine-endopeptidase (penicillin-binding protein 4)
MLLVVATTSTSALADRPASAGRPVAATRVGAPPAVDRLTHALDQILADARFDGSQVGLQVRDAGSGAGLYSHDAGQRLVPASNNKLLTSAAALEVLGPGYRFHTGALVSGQRHGGVLAGDLYLKGTGDPTMLAADYDRLAGAVAASGLRVVTGELVADDTWFDGTRLGTDWAWDDEPYYYAAQVSALTVAPDTDYDAGTVIVASRPGSTAGQPASLTLVPPNDYVRIVNRATTGPAGSGNTISVDREHGSNTIVVSGSIPMGSDVDQEWASVWEPTAYAAAVFRAALTRHGVRVVGRTSSRATPEDARSVSDHVSMTLGELLVPFLKLSNNGHAEVLTKAMGRQVYGEGSWPAGIRAARTALASLGVDTSALRIVDGSGLSRQDLLTNQQITNLLVAAQARTWFPTWYASLPIAGEPDRLIGGTLRSRMTGTPAAHNVHAKTGSLTGVNALSGYVTDADGHRLVFSMVANNYLVGVTSLVDAVAVTLASFSATTTSPLPAANSISAPPAPTNRDGDELECSWAKAC